MMMMSMMKGGMGGKGKGKGKGGGKWEDWEGRGPGDWGKYVIDESAGVLGEYTGTIKSFSGKNGYGFIDCADLKAMGYQDVFMHGDMKKDLPKGTTVSFTAFLTGKGQLQAKDVNG